MYLLINNALIDRIQLALTNNKISLDFKARLQQSEKLLPAIDKLLKKNKTTLNKLKGIMVISGPGSFTALRIGIATANTLAYSLKIPVVEIKLGELKKEDDIKEILEQGSKKLKKQKKFKIVLPYYSKEPNITKAKK